MERSELHHLQETLANALAALQSAVSSRYAVSEPIIAPPPGFSTDKAAAAGRVRDSTRSSEPPPLSDAGGSVVGGRVEPSVSNEPPPLSDPGDRINEGGLKPGQHAARSSWIWRCIVWLRRRSSILAELFQALLNRMRG